MSGGYDTDSGAGWNGLVSKIIMINPDHLDTITDISGIFNILQPDVPADISGSNRSRNPYKKGKSENQIP